jgi:hypothetical protein
MMDRIIFPPDFPGNEINIQRRQLLRDGVPCSHPGCLKHVTHPCEGCGRVGGRRECQHERLNEDGICRVCGKDRRGI